MVVPLVALAVLAAVGGIINLPFSGFLHLEHWLEPVYGDRLHHLTSGAGTKLTLAAVTTAAALVGIGTAYLVYLRHRVREEAVEPRVLQQAWYVDDLYRATVEAPGRALSDWAAYVFDRRVIDGAVNGVGALVRAGGSRLRGIQTGFVRNYALGVAGGAVAVLAYVLTRTV
jgi:NADH-quinone oxidoreductase subunit L